MKSKKKMIELDEYHRPQYCKECNGIMIFKGVGEYQCEDCNALEYDDYGKVRLYIEKHKGATAAEVEAAIGVKQRSIRNMLKEGRFEISSDSKAFLYCELCGNKIRYGRLCKECEIDHHRCLEANRGLERKTKKQGFGLGKEGASGEKRFRWEK